MPKTKAATAPACRILVVEDDITNRRLLTKVLTDEGYRVDYCAHGRDVPTFLARFQPDLVVLDIGLEDIDGYEVTRRIRATGNKVPIIIVTGRGTPDETVKGFAAGADDYIVKPYNFDVLKARIRVQLNRRQRYALPSGDLRRLLALRIWPLSLVIVFLALAQAGDGYPGLPNAQVYNSVMSWAAIVATGAVVVWHNKGVRYLHVFFAFSTCVVRSLFGLIGWTNAPDSVAQLLGAAVWGSLALAVLTVYLLTLPFVVDEQIDKTVAV